jgi:dimeric dUTPase (all-alpha-NTP-PPase superfamily)
MHQIFKMQADLNDYVFKKKNIKDQEGQILTTEKLIESGKQENIGPNTLTNEWLTKYLVALDDESRELREELLWKWWSKDTLNMQNIRVEIIDQLHFWVSLAMSAGMTADDVNSIYEQKWKKNFERQDADYSKATKYDDNKEIK